VINTGIIGFSTLQEFFLLKHNFYEIQPDYIVLQMYTNDFMDNLTPDGAYPHPYIDHLNHFTLTRYPAPHMNYSYFLQGLEYVGEHTFFLSTVTDSSVYILDEIKYRRQRAAKTRTEP
jgi:hypothetical protein